MIQIEQFSKRYGSFWAVKDLNLHVKRGEVFGFLGPNGAGKTTTMKVMVGLVRPTAGRIRVGGLDVVQDPIRAKQIVGYIPDRPYLYEKLTAEEFLAFTASIYGLDYKQQTKRADDLLHMFGLEDWRAELVESYSHGMKQRLTMAAALLHRPELLVVDEPMVGLDPQGAELVKGLFRRISTELGGTVFLSTHTLEVAEELCDRVAILYKGAIVAQGTMDELRAQVGDDGGEHLHELFLRLTGGDEAYPRIEDVEL